MTYEEKLDIIREQGFTEYQVRYIYEEMGCAAIDDEEELIDAAMEWYEMEQSYEESREVC